MIKTEEVEKEDLVIDDVSHLTVKEELDLGELAKLKAKMAKVQEKEVMPPKILEKRKTSLNFGFIGSGQAGSRLVSAAYKLGYQALAFNTTTVDLEHIQLPDEHKILLDYGLGGASKDPEIGHAAAQTHKDLIYATIADKLDSAQVLVLCTSLGGGSGGGSIDTMVDVMTALQKPIVVITVLPMTSEDPQTKKNALGALSKLTGMVQSKAIANLIVVDNTKLEVILSDVSMNSFYELANEAILEPLDIFNVWSSQPSSSKALDPTEFSKILLDGEGLSLYGSMTCVDWQGSTSLAEAVVSNLTSGLLAEGFDLKQTKYAGVMFLANKKVWDQMPSININYAMALIGDFGQPLGVFRGIYEDNSIKEDVVKVYSFFSGLALPDARVAELKKEITALNETLKAKDVSRNLNLNIENDSSKTTSAADLVRQKIKQKSSAFGKFTKDVVDKRKK